MFINTRTMLRQTAVYEHFFNTCNASHALQQYLLYLREAIALVNR